ncbi:MAG: hypothetical protein DMF79_14940 [Acidobacteria bacterium]|nr:MAG: hypothetical protein DMF79_14940 [Acidobacteriota bacterium]
MKQSDHGAYVRKVQEGAQSFAHDLLGEIERLQVLVATLEAEIRAETRAYSSRYAEIELQNSNLANLYVASYRLHGTLDRQEVIDTIKEIIANLVGSEEAGLFELDPGKQCLELVASFGISPEACSSVPLGSGLIGRAAQTGEIYVADPGRPPAGAGLEGRLTACIPLSLDGRVTGAIAIFRLLPQKAGIEDLDRELFGLLATHAATALYCTTLHQRLAVEGAGR